MYIIQFCDFPISLIIVDCTSDFKLNIETLMCHCYVIYIIYLIYITLKNAILTSIYTHELRLFCYSTVCIMCSVQRCQIKHR